MDAAMLVLVCLNLALVIGVLLLLVRRAGAGVSPELRQELQAQRGELAQAVADAGRQTDARLRLAADAQSAELARERDARAASAVQQSELLSRSLGHLRAAMEERFDVLRGENEYKLDQMRRTLAEELEKLRTGNERGLEKMRETVDEKLQGTLEKRLGESFSLVSDRLEQVQKGLGEMQTLASDVGGLKRVLTNVKSRGGWGEVQLARQLEDVLTREQYGENVAVRPDSADRVEFAVKLPGAGAGAGAGDGPVWLPIDSKFPQEDYERLLEAQEAADPVAVEAAGRAIERAVLEQARLIAAKYIEPPHTTDFAIMYLPTEGLFAEVVRRPGFVSRLQNDHRITIAGPTTLTSLLNSLQMGFRTLAIEQRSSEVWKVLSAAKAEFEKYGDVWDRVGKQLQTVQRTVEQAGTRTRVLQRKLQGVESQSAGESAQAVVAEALPALDLGGVGDDTDLGYRVDVERLRDEI